MKIVRWAAVALGALFARGLDTGASTTGVVLGGVHVAHGALAEPTAGTKRVLV